MTDKIYIFDTTLRDGEQSPGASMNLHEKIQIPTYGFPLNTMVYIFRITATNYPLGYLHNWMEK